MDAAVSVWKRVSSRLFNLESRIILQVPCGAHLLVLLVLKLVVMRMLSLLTVARQVLSQGVI
jgi:hypothetical protein